MIEEIKTDNNCIVKAFENNPISIIHEDVNDKKIYYFKASDVGNVLGIVNIRTSIMNFDEDEKVVRTTYSSNSGNPDTIFLSSQGVYRLLYNSKKEVAKKFRKWAGNILDDIIFNESAELKRQIEEKETVLQETSKQLENKDKLLEEKDTIITNNERVKKVEKHNFLIEKFKNKKCVYIAEIKDDLIKIGSTKDIKERCNGLSRTFGNCIFLDIFEHVDYQTVESNILINVKPHIYKEPINNHVSKEVVQLSNNFNYKQLRGIVVHCVNTTDFLSPLEILEKQKLDNESQKLDNESQKLNNESQKLNIIQELLNNGEPLKNIIDLFSHNNTNTDVLSSPIKKEQEQEKQELEENKQTDTVNVSKQIINSQVFFKGKKPRGQKIHKIDPNNLQNIIKTYDSMVYLLRSPECYGYNKSGILKAISDSRIYKGYRWNFINKETMPTVEYKSSTPIRDAILQLNETKDSIIETFTTKDEAAKILGIAKLSMRNIIKNQEKHNNYYYIEYSKCPLNIIEKYDNPIFGINSIRAKKIKQINPITNTYIFFNNLNEIQLKLGISSKTIINSINNKTVHAGSLWEFA
jgi:prophage antirepressor-like protein